MSIKSALLAGLIVAAGAGCSSADGASSLYNPPQSGVEAGLEAASDDALSDAVDEVELVDVLVESATEPEAALADSAVSGADCESTDDRRFACCTFLAVNDYRTSLGLSALIWDPQIAAAAEWYSQHMADLGVLEHGLDGKMVGTRLSDFGVDWTAAGENIARNTTDAWQDSCVQVFDQWYGSPSHHALMVSTKYTHGAVGVASGGGWWYATLNVVAH